MIKLIIVLLALPLIFGFTNQECEHFTTGEIKIVRILPKGTNTVPCQVEIVRKIPKGKTIRFIKYRATAHFKSCETLAAKELLKALSSDYMCGKER